MGCMGFVSEFKEDFRALCFLRTEQAMRARVSALVMRLSLGLQSGTILGSAERA